jgi:hypothetical protein
MIENSIGVNNKCRGKDNNKVVWELVLIMVLRLLTDLFIIKMDNLKIRSYACYIYTHMF